MIQNVSSSSHHEHGQFEYVRVLSIAGSDSGGGAGIQADIKTASALGCFGMSAIAAITAQNTLGVQAVLPVSAEMLKAQIDSVLGDIGADAVKIGMLHSPQLVEVVAQSLKRYKCNRVVLDPVMVATSGDLLIAPETAQLLIKELFPLATLITPNLDEAAWLTSATITNKDEMLKAAHDLQAQGAINVLVKGGHLPGDETADLLLEADGKTHWLESERIPTHNGHGTGCTLSSAIACYLAQGASLIDAVRQGRDYILGAISAGAHVRTGAGAGPLNHGYAPRSQIIKN